MTKRSSCCLPKTTDCGSPFCSPCLWKGKKTGKQKSIYFSSFGSFGNGVYVCGMELRYSLHLGMGREKFSLFSEPKTLLFKSKLWGYFKSIEHKGADDPKLLGLPFSWAAWMYTFQHSEIAKRIALPGQTQGGLAQQQPVASEISQAGNEGEGRVLLIAQNIWFLEHGLSLLLSTNSKITSVLSWGEAKTLCWPLLFKTVVWFTYTWMSWHLISGGFRNKESQAVL